MKRSCIIEKIICSGQPGITRLEVQRGSRLSCIQAWSELVCNKRNTTKSDLSTGHISKRFQLVESNEEQTKNMVLQNLYRSVENDKNCHFTERVV